VLLAASDTGTGSCCGDVSGDMGEAVMQFEYLCQPPKKWTFEQPKLKKWVEGWCVCRGEIIVLNLFAGKTRLEVDEFRVDISDEYKPDAIEDCRDFVARASSQSFATVILDPPYTWRKAKEKYGGKMIGQYPRLKDELLYILTPSARVISLGWDTVGMSKSRGFKKIAVCIVCHGRDHRDTLCLVEERV